MFRYIGLSWDVHVDAHAALAQRFSQALQARGDWQGVLLRAGLHVFATGVQPGANGVYALHDGAGVVLGRLFRRRDAEQPSALDIRLTSSEMERIVDSGGGALVADYWGRYVAFLTRTPLASRVLRDPSGALPCYQMRHAGVGITFSWLEDVLTALPDLPTPSVHWEHLAAHIAFVALSGRETAIDGVEEILPGESASLDATSQPPALLWNAAEIARAASGEEVAVSARLLRQTVRACAQSWASSHDQILLRLSGGVDSAILLSCLDHDSTATRITCVNYHSPGANSDERPYARLAAARADRSLIERSRDANFRLERILDGARTPSPGTYLGRLGTPRMDAELAAETGATALFTGGGGDQLFFEFRGWWPAADYLRLRGLDSGFTTAAMDAARLSRLSVWRTLRWVVADRLGCCDPWRDAETHLALAVREALPAAVDRMRFAHPALRGVSDLPIGKHIQVQQLLYPIDGYDPYERDAAPDLLNPLLSQPVIERCLATPTHVLTHGGRGRGLARLAFSADLPEEIASRRSKGGMEEHVATVLLRNLDFARSLLLDGKLVARGLLDRSKVETALSGRPTTLAAHTGEVHIYLGVEAWLQQWSAVRHRSCF